VILAHIAGIPVEEWLMPFIISAGAALVGIRAVFGSSQSSMVQRNGRRADRRRARRARSRAHPQRDITMSHKNSR
jgi:hypothetical protein